MFRKVLFIAVILLTISLGIHAQAPLGDRVFNVRGEGAKGDCTAAGSLGSCTNDVVALRRALAKANAAGGGVVYFPATATNAYYILVGDPASDTNLTNIDPNHYAIFNVTSNNITFQFARGVTLRVVSSYLYQTNSGGGAIPGQVALFWFGNQVTVIENFQLDGEYPTLSFELASPAAYFTGDNSANGFLLQSGKTKRCHWKRFYVTGFPQGGLLDGYTSGSDQFTDAIYEDMRVLEYGSGGDDLWFYTYGRTTFLRCWFITSRKSSHGIYAGATKPGVVIKDCFFSGQDESAHLANKYGIQVYQTSGTDAIADWTIEGNTFYNVYNGIWIEHVNGGSGGQARNLKIINNNFIRSNGTPAGSAAIQAQWLNDSEISGNYFYAQANGVSIISSGPGKNVTITRNRCVDCTTLMSVNTAQSNISQNSYRRSSISGTGATRFNVAGARNVVSGNEIIDGGSSAGSPVGMIINGAGNIASENIFYATASQGYSIILQAANCTQCQITKNHINHLGSAYSDLSGDEMLVGENQSNKLITVAGTGSAFTKVIGNNLWGSSQIRLTGKCQPVSNTVTGGWETITGAYAGNGNITSSTALDSITVTTSGTYNPHVGVYSTFLITANGNLTLSTPTNPTDGQQIRIVVLQDATGGRSVSFSSAYVTSGSVTTTASTRSSWTFVYDTSVSKFIQVGPILSGF